MEERSLEEGSEAVGGAWRIPLSEERGHLSSEEKGEERLEIGSVRR